MENNKIDLTEILKDCPTGTKLYSPIFGDVYLDKIRPHLAIVVTTDKEQGDVKEEFLYDGRYGMNGECMLFPSKNKTTWEEFQRPFQDGDIIFTCAMFNKLSKYLNLGMYYTWISIFHKMRNNEVVTYVDMLENDMIDYPFWMYEGELCRTSDNMFQRLATEEEKERLFKFLKDNGCKWNAETKTLETLIEPKFKVGDRIRCKNGINKYTSLEECEILSITGNMYGIGIPHLTGNDTHIPIVDQDKWELVTLKFKTGDRIRCKNDIDKEGEIKSVSFNFYTIFTTDEKFISICIGEQDEWELISNEVKPKFKDGDIVYFMCNRGDEYIAIFKKMGNKYLSTYIHFNSGSFTGISEHLIEIDYIKELRLATEEEKQKLFDGIKDYGYYWNKYKKTLNTLVTPKFKVGDKIRKIKNTNRKYIINKVNELTYVCYVDNYHDIRIPIKSQDYWELVPDKFDISTLKPFESRVLVRQTKDEIWRPAIFGCYNGYRYYVLGNVHWVYCIPYEGNEHLCGKTADCNEYYKTWET